MAELDNDFANKLINEIFMEDVVYGIFGAFNGAKLNYSISENYTKDIISNQPKHFVISKVCRLSFGLINIFKTVGDNRYYFIIGNVDNEDGYSLHGHFDVISEAHYLEYLNDGEIVASDQRFDVVGISVFDWDAEILKCLEDSDFMKEILRRIIKTFMSYKRVLLEFSDTEADADDLEMNDQSLEMLFIHFIKWIQVEIIPKLAITES